jgi:hypothetical protein
MTVAYCIAAHTRPSQCRRLVLRLLEDDPRCLVLLHYDQRESPLDLQEVTGPRVRVLRERPVFWGSTHLVDLFVEMFQEAVAAECAYAVMLSGQDYPLFHVGGLESELSGYDVWADLNALFAPDGSCNWPEGRRRYSYRWWHIDRTPRAARGTEAVAAKVLHVPTSASEPPLPSFVRLRIGNEIWWGAKRGGPGVPIYTGSTWMSLSSRAVEAIISSPRRVSSFFHHVPNADEAYFHTVLGNTTGLTFAPGDARCIQWTQGEAHPEVLTADDLDGMVASGAHFGRKFDELVDSSVLDRLDVLSRSSNTLDAKFIDDPTSCT